jgi:hypothetical protein
MSKKKTMKTQQQGDVNIWRIGEIPAEAKKLPGGRVRDGEMTGHAHKIEGTDFQLYELGGRVLAKIMSGDCSIVHEEHKAQTLTPGCYEFGPTYEYDYDLEERREVAD